MCSDDSSGDEGCLEYTPPGKEGSVRVWNGTDADGGRAVVLRGSGGCAQLGGEGGPGPFVGASDWRRDQPEVPLAQPKGSSTRGGGYAKPGWV